MTTKQPTRAELIAQELDRINRTLDAAGSPNAGRYEDIQAYSGHMLTITDEHGGAERLSVCMTGAAFLEMLRTLRAVLDIEANGSNE